MNEFSLIALGSKKALIIARRQAKLSGEMENMIVLVLTVNQNNGASERKSRNSAMWSGGTAILSDNMRK